MIPSLSLLSRSPVLPDFRIAKREFVNLHIPPRLQLSLDREGGKYEPVGEYPRRVQPGEVLAEMQGFPLLAPLAGAADLMDGQIRIRVSGALHASAKDQEPSFSNVEAFLAFCDDHGLFFLDDGCMPLSRAVRLSMSGQGIRAFVLSEADAELPVYWKSVFAEMAVERLRFEALLREVFPKIHVFRTRPVGDKTDFFHGKLLQPSVLIKRALRSRSLRHPRSWLEDGVVYLSPLTLYALMKALFQGEPFTHRPVVFRDFFHEQGKGKDVVARLPNGSMPADIFADVLPPDGWEAPGQRNDSSEFWPGLAISIERDAAFYRFRRVRGTMPCTGCRACNDVCPVDARPLSLLFDAKRFDRLSCFECGLCELVCEANIPLSALIGGRP